jgi:hypothetical protein
VRYSVEMQAEEEAREDVIALADEVEERLIELLGLVRRVKRLHAVLALHGLPEIKIAYEEECSRVGARARVVLLG